MSAHFDGVSSGNVTNAQVSESGVSRGRVKSENFFNFFYLKNIDFFFAPKFFDSS